MKVTSSDFKAGRRGVVFKNGKLYQFEPNFVLVMRAWPDPRAWFKRRSHGWKANRKWADDIVTGTLLAADHPLPPKPRTPYVEPNGQMRLPGVRLSDELRAWTAYYEENAQAAYFASIPVDVRFELLRYFRRKWHLLNVFARCPGSLEMSRSNPAMLYALASNWVFHKPAVRHPMREIRRLLCKKQRHILSWLGFPGTESVRRILTAIPAAELDIERLLYLRDAFGIDGVHKLLSHAPALNRHTLELICHPRLRPHVSPRLLEEVVHVDNNLTVACDYQDVDDGIGLKTETVVDLLRDTVRMATQIGWERCPKPFHSLSRLQEVHEYLSRRFQDIKALGQEPLPAYFQVPPYPGNNTIIPLTTPTQMFEEGRAQRNCVYSHAPMVAQGYEYVYQVIAPIRATFSIRLRRGGWVPDQLYLANNKPVGERVREQLFKDLVQTRGREAPEAETIARIYNEIAQGLYEEVAV